MCSVFSPTCSDSLHIPVCSPHAAVVIGPTHNIHRVVSLVVGKEIGLLP